MTREEAIQEFQNVKDLIRQDGKDWFDERDLELIDMAIEALSVANLKEEFESADAETSTFNKETSTLGEKHQLSHGRLIDADELKKHLDGAWEELNDDGERKGVRLARWYLISAPTVDSTIDVVRCKDCKYFELDHFDRIDDMPIITAHEICTKWSGGSKTSKDGFCFMGERREP